MRKESGFAIPQVLLALSILIALGGGIALVALSGPQPQNNEERDTIAREQTSNDAEANLVEKDERKQVPDTAEDVRPQPLPPKSPPPSLPPPSSPSESARAAEPPPLTCESNPTPLFTNHITDMSKVNYIAPPPTMGAGPSLKTHSYIGTDHARVPLFAPTAMTLESGAYYIGGPYMMEFRVSCEVKVRFGHVTEPTEAIRKLFPAEPKSDSRTQGLPPITFAAGELVGYTTGTDMAGNWDFGVYNSTVRNRYADDPEWNNSTTYTTAVCPFDYFPAEMRAVYVAKFNSATLGGNPPHGEPFCKN